MLSLPHDGRRPITDRATALTGLVIAAAIGLFTTILFGALSDRVGRRPIYFVGTSC